MKSAASTRRNRSCKFFPSLAGEMAKLSLWSGLTAPSVLDFPCLHPYHVPALPSNSREFRLSAAKSGISSVIPVAKKCQTCRGQGAIECSGCKGTGKNKKNGNIFERWKCFDCQGFGLKSCPTCGKGGLTPEQRGER